VPDSPGEIALDAGVADMHDTPAADAGPASAQTPAVSADAGATAAVSGDGASPEGVGEGLGFGSGGFGTGSGGPLGAIIALHADLDRIRSTSLILETSALLDIIPEWQQLLAGSGLDALSDFSRVFVATPSLRRSQLVVSGRLKGGEQALARAVGSLAAERGKSAGERDESGIREWPWYNRGPTERVVGLFGSDQIVIARPADVGRVLSVSAALAQRHAEQPGMEHASGPAALLALYEDEAVALSVEGVGQFVEGDVPNVPRGLRISLRHVDEYNAELRARAFYKTAAEAEAAFATTESLRRELADSPRAGYLGLRSAIEEAKFDLSGSTVSVQTQLTMHQTRYLLSFVSKALAPRE
jgi:hypothetical protein